MATEIKIDRREHEIGLFDSDTDKSLKAEKAVDITDDCPGLEPGRRAVMLFTSAKRGRIVQLAQPYKGEVYMGVHIHFFVDELAKEMNIRPQDDTFGSWARDFGLDKQQLRSLIETNAPR